MSLTLLPCQPEGMVAGQTLPRRSRPYPPLSPCLGGSQELTATPCPLPEPRAAVDHQAQTAPSATAPCQCRPQSTPCPRSHRPPLSRSPRPPLHLALANTPDIPVRRPKPHNHRSPWTPPPLPLRAPPRPDRVPPPLRLHSSSRAPLGNRPLIATPIHASTPL